MKLLLPLAFVLLIACTKTETAAPNTPATPAPTTKRCYQQTQTTYDKDGKITTQSTRYYTNGLIDSAVGYNQSGQTKTYSTTIYEYNTSKTERKAFFYTNGVYQNYYFLEAINSYGDVVKSQAYINDNTDGSYTEISYTCK